MNDTYVFYHAYLINNWEEVFNDHLCELIAGELYNFCRKIYIGAVYKNSAELASFLEIIKPYKKIELVYEREFGDLKPVWSRPDFTPDIQLGESETILKMVEFAQTVSPRNKYLFYHAKGVTSPPSIKRSTTEYFRKKGFSGKTNAEMNQFIHEDMKSIVSDWQKYNSLLETDSFFYSIWNFFWASGELLHQFDFSEFIEKQGTFYPADRQFYPLRDRHVFSLFPVKLYAICNEITCCKETRELIDCGPSDIKEHEESKPHFGSMYSEAIQLLHNGRIEASRKKCLEMLSLWPEEPNILHLVGITYFEQRNYEEAIAYINEAIRAKDDNPSYYYNLANVYSEKGELDRAVLLYERSLEMNPNQAESLVNLGGIYGKMNNIQKSLHCFQKALNINPNHVQALVNLGLLYSKIGEFDHSINFYQRAMSNKLSPALHSRISELLHKAVQRQQTERI